MIKKLIFDIDNTLIIWKKSYSKKTILETYKTFNIDCNNELIKKTDEIILNYEKIHLTFDKEILLKDLNNLTNQNLPINFIDEYLKNCIKYATPQKLPDEEIETLKYLSKKYELVALTNWFLNPQIERLKKANIYKYFSNVIAADTIAVKPNKESFLNAIQPNKIEECCMIGDNLDIDIMGALNIGLKAIFLTSNSNYIQLKDCICINKFDDLQKIL